MKAGGKNSAMKAEGKKESAIKAARVLKHRNEGG
jgi:hypothetical protein